MRPLKVSLVKYNTNAQLKTQLNVSILTPKRIVHFVNTSPNGIDDYVKKHVFITEVCLAV